MQQALEATIQATEPAIASILVTHSDAYRKFFHDEPPADEPGRLGTFTPGQGSHSQQHPPPRARWPRPNDNDRQDEKYDLASRRYVPESYGSGVVIDSRNLLVLTNYHVVRDATKIYVRLPGDKGSYADIHAADPYSDLAVLHLLNEGIRPLKEIKLGDASQVRKGEFVVALANPYATGFRDGSPSASCGIISNIRRRASLAASEEELKLSSLPSKPVLLQTDAKISPGCSGGALLNLKGEMIGLTTSRAALTGTESAGGFALPIDAGMKRIIENLRQGAEVEYGFLGVNFEQDSSGGLEGVRVAAIPGSPAERAGLSRNEEILSINGVRVHDLDELTVAVATALAGSEVRLEIAGRRQLLTAELAKTYVPGKVIASKKPPLVRGFRVDYTSVLYTQQSALQGQRAWGRPFIIQDGVVVREVQPGSPADVAELRVGEVITHVNDQKVTSPAEFYRALEKILPRARLELTLLVTEGHRARTSTTLTIP